MSLWQLHGAPPQSLNKTPSEAVLQLHLGYEVLETNSLAGVAPRVSVLWEASGSSPKSCVEALGTPWTTSRADARAPIALPRATRERMLPPLRQRLWKLPIAPSPSGLRKQRPIVSTCFRRWARTPRPPAAARRRSGGTVVSSPCPRKTPVMPALRSETFSQSASSSLGV